MGIAVGVAVLVLGLSIAIATRPKSFRVERSATIAAPADAIFQKLHDFHAWKEWSPFEGLDPNLTRGYEGPRSGVGAVYTWSGNARAGRGRMTIRECEPPSRVIIDLEFEKPMKAKSVAAFTLQPKSDGSVQVTWSTTGDNTFMGKAFSLVADMDKLLGKDFERGLANLKTLAESDGAMSAPRIEA